MSEGKLLWVSPKGYGFAKLHDGRRVFVPSHLVPKDHFEGQLVRIRVEEDEDTNRIRCLQLEKVDGFLFGDESDGQIHIESLPST